VADERPIDDPERLAEEARAAVEKSATQLRARDLAIEIEPPTPFVP